MHLPFRTSLCTSQLKSIRSRLTTNAAFDARRQSWHSWVVVPAIWMILPWLSKIITFLERALHMTMLWSGSRVLFADRSKSLHLVIGKAVHRDMFARRLLTALIKQVLLISRHSNFVLTSWSTTLLLIHKLLFSTSKHLLAIVYALANVLTRIGDLVAHHLRLATLSNHAHDWALTRCLSWSLIISAVVGRWGSYNPSIFVWLIHTILNFIIKSILILALIVSTIFGYLDYALYISLYVDRSWLSSLILFLKALTIFYIKIIITKLTKNFKIYEDWIFYP